MVQTDRMKRWHYVVNSLDCLSKTLSLKNYKFRIISNNEPIKHVGRFNVKNNGLLKALQSSEILFSGGKAISMYS